MSQLLKIKNKSWLSQSGPVIISGPCSAESEEQVMQSMTSIAATGKVHMLRAGIWKPRTRPNSFEGVGVDALIWLINAGKETNLPVTVEVASAKHTEEALKAGIDVLWIGARTTVNPFSVQEIADVLKGVDIPVNPDLSLWLGAFERLSQSGITKLAAIHRGFSSFEKSVYRNIPQWDLPIELKRMFPELPIICDPSHISGNRDLIGLVAQKALDLEMDGLMIESHISPKDAWSDADQQLSPTELRIVLNDLIVRDKSSLNTEFKTKLEELRTEIDKLDEEIIYKLGARMKVAIEIGKYKRDNKVTILQVDRWNQLKNERKKLGIAIGLNDAFVDQLLRIIHKESIDQQASIMNA
jgi:chorismate mutase